MDCSTIKICEDCNSQFLEEHPTSNKRCNMCDVKLEARERAEN